MPATPAREFLWYEGFAFFLAAIANQLSSEFMAQWGPYFYSPTEGGGRIIYVSIESVWIIFFFGRVFDAITDPLVGAWSDVTSPKPGWMRIVPIHGRRRPFIFWGSVLMTVTSIVFWFPPTAHASQTNVVFGTAVFTIHLGLFTVVLVPLMALGPEIARSKQARVNLGIWIAAGMIVGLLLGAVVPGVLISTLDTARDEGGFSPVGFQRTAIVFALVSLAFFMFLVFAVRERYPESQPKVEGSSLWAVLADMYSTLKNPTFLLYLAAFFLFNVGFLATQRVLPNWAEVGLGGDEGTVTILLLPFVLCALITAFGVMPWLARFAAMKWMLFAAFAIIVLNVPLLYPIGASDASLHTKIAMGAALFFVCGIAQGMLYVLQTPMIGEIIDLDAKRTGFRREGAYNGMYTFAVKGGQSMSIVVSNLCMSTFGNSVENPRGILLVGPVAGAFALLGLVIVWFYPILHVTRERADGNVS